MNIAQLIEKKMKKYNVTGCSAALVEGQHTLWAKGFGYADKENKIAAAEDTRYLIGSTSKVFTGTAVMQLADRGLVDTDKPVQQYIPEFLPKTRFRAAQPITVRNLMTHHSGLSGDNFDRFYVKDPNDQTETFRDTLTYLKEHYAPYPPNYIWAYSNLATNLLGIIVERVSGMDFCQYIKENILLPLKMHNSFNVTEKGVKASMAKTYMKGKFEEEYFLRDLPAGNIVSTAADMACFIKMVLGEGCYEGSEVLKATTMRQMLTPQNDDIALDIGFKMGLNWILHWPYFNYAGRVCWHDGSSVHYNSMLIILPDQKLGLTILSNSTTALPVFMREVAEEILIEALEVKGLAKPIDGESRPSPKTVMTGLENKAGTFASIMGQARIKMNRGHLKLHMKGMNFKLMPCADGWFSLKYKLLGIIPINIKSLKNTRINVLDINNERVFAIEQRVSTQEFRQVTGREFVKTAVPEAWINRAGKYEVMDKDSNIFKTINLICSGGVLSIKARARKMGKLHITLQAVADDEAIIMGYGRFANDTLWARNENGKEVLELFGIRLARSI